MGCQHFRPNPLSRREMLVSCANGFGAVALAALLTDSAFGAPQETDAPTGPLTSKAGHHPAKARSVIFLYMDGGPSQMDTFDPKPRLDREHGEPIKMKTPPTQFDNVGMVLKSPWKFRPRGESGIPVSDLFPHVAQCADDLAIIRSMTSQFSEHTSANYFLHTGSGLQGRPSMGAWTTYGLGTECQNLPGFVVLDSGQTPPGGQQCFSSGFLPATFQGSIFQRGQEPVADIAPREVSELAQRNKLALLDTLDREHLHHAGATDDLESAIANYELAFRMQTAVPELADFSDESPATLAMYGFDNPTTEVYAQRCLMARRLVERGVRFIEVLCPPIKGDRWDQHSDLVNGHGQNAAATDQPVAALLKDLKQRGLLDQTLVVWGGEFGRTPMAQGSDGRDHNPFGFSIWMAGGGIRGGSIYGATDDYGYFAVENPLQIHDLHATMLHLLGVDHERLTFRYGGRDMRLTDVHGRIIHDILA